MHHLNHTVDGKTHAIPKYFWSRDPDAPYFALRGSKCQGEWVQEWKYCTRAHCSIRQSWKRVQDCCVIVLSHIAHASAQCRSPLVFRMHFEEFLQPWLQAKPFQYVRLQPSFHASWLWIFHIFERTCFLSQARKPAVCFRATMKRRIKWSKAGYKKKGLKVVNKCLCHTKQRSVKILSHLLLWGDIAPQTVGARQTLILQGIVFLCFCLVCLCSSWYLGDIFELPL